MTGGVHDQSRGVSIARGPLQSPRGHLFRPSHRGKVAATGRLLSGAGRPAVAAFSPHQNESSIRSAAALFGLVTVSQAALQKFAVRQDMATFGRAHAVYISPRTRTAGSFGSNSTSAHVSRSPSATSRLS